MNNITYKIAKYMPKKLFIHLLYFIKMRKTLFAKPVTFSEKINHMKLDNSLVEFYKYADKYEVRNYINKMIGPSYLSKLYGVYSAIDEIDIKTLPKKCVFKATHGSGWVFICKDIEKINIDEFKKDLTCWLSRSYYDCSKEDVYKKIKPRIVCEEYLEDSNGELLDYKFFCFNGVPKYVQVDVDRYTKHTRCFYDMNWNKQDFTLHFPFYKGEVKKLINFELMVELCKKLSCDFRFVRVDLYNLNGMIYFGELTFTPGTGNERFYPPKYDKIFGELLK